MVVAGIHAESNLRSDRPIRRSDFSDVAGQALLEHPDFADLSVADVTLVGGYRARAASGGAVEPATLAVLIERLVAHIEAIEDVDGIMVCTHGGMRMLEDVDADGAWITRLRAAVGPNVPIVGVFDTHGTPSRRTLSALDGVTTYRTVPHVDQAAAMQRAIRQLRRRIEGQARPQVVFEPVPLRLPAERASTQRGPLCSVIEQLEQAAEDGIDADVFIGQAWAPAGVPTAGVVAIGADEVEARRWARRFARDLWNQRHAFEYPVIADELDGISTQLEHAGNERLVIADSGDAPGGGAHGDRLDLLDIVTAQPRLRSLVIGVAIPAWIHACAGWLPGTAVELQHPLADRRYLATVVSPARALGAYGSCAVVSMQNVTVVVVEKRGDPPAPHLLECIGVDPEAYPVVVLKTGFIPDTYLAGRTALLALSPGVTDHRAVAWGP